MLQLIHIVHFVLISLVLLIFTKFNLGVSTKGVLSIVIIALIMTFAHLLIDNFRRRFRYNVMMHIAFLSLNIGFLFVIDNFYDDFSINNTGLGILLGVVIVGIFSLGFAARKAILGDRE